MKEAKRTFRRPGMADGAMGHGSARIKSGLLEENTVSSRRRIHSKDVPIVAVADAGARRLHRVVGHLTDQRKSIGVYMVRE